MNSIEELKKGLEEMEFKDPDFRNSSYMRLRVLKDLRRNGYLDKNLEWHTSASAGKMGAK